MDDLAGLMTKVDFIDLLEHSKIRIDGLVEGAISLAEEIHQNVKREDGVSSFLETHTWAVAARVIAHYKSVNRPITSIEVVSAILHDIMEDNDRINDLYQTHSYGFEAYLDYRFGKRVSDIAKVLKVPRLDDFPGSNDKQKERNRFATYSEMLLNSDYDVKSIKLADRINNMKFIKSVGRHQKVARYIREAEDFYLAYCIIQPRMEDFYAELRQQYDDLRLIKEKETIAA